MIVDYREPVHTQKNIYYIQSKDSLPLWFDLITTTIQSIQAHQPIHDTILHSRTEEAPVAGPNA